MMVRFNVFYLCFVAECTVGFLFNSKTSFQTHLDSATDVLRASLFPTFWCGARNSAPFKNAISSIYPNLDKCCRNHDLCPKSIDRGECFRKICNRSHLLPILDCQCESKFRNCLRSVSKSKSNRIFALTWNERFLSDITGIFYFKLLPKLISHKCLKLSPPIIECSQYSSESYPFLEASCVRYKVNKTLPFEWQLFDIPPSSQKWFDLSNYASDVTNLNQLRQSVHRLVNWRKTHKL